MVLGVVGAIAALIRRSDRMVGIRECDGVVGVREQDTEHQDPSWLTGEAKIARLGLPSVKAVMREAAAKQRKHEEEERVLRQEQRLAEALGRHKCFCKHNGETLGPVTLWQVREMIEVGLFDPDIPVILEGSDYWHTYAEQEVRAAPPLAP